MNKLPLTFIENVAHVFFSTFRLYYRYYYIHNLLIFEQIYRVVWCNRYYCLKIFILIIYSTDQEEVKKALLAELFSATPQETTGMSDATNQSTSNSYIFLICKQSKKLLYFIKPSLVTKSLFSAH